LAARADDSDWVLVHDAARPCLARADLDRLIVALIDDDVGGLLAERVGDTLKREDPMGERSAETLERSGIWRAQTPQMFRLQVLRDALKMAIGNGAAVTDEASAIEALGLKPRFVAGSPQNIKVTHAEDLELARAILARRGPGPGIRVGTGFDAHAFGDGDHVMLGGVRIAHARGVLAHSDGDVIIHALCDALLGAAGLGDIGEHFADTDPRWRGAASRIFLERVMQMLTERRLQVINADITLLAEEPKVAPHREVIRRTLAELLHLRMDAVNLKATTLERMGFIGRGEGLAAQAIVLLAPAA
jgi:2-C-methyl-D-erythritol 4-phosphate cytidylyltransferase / 2-C-methyl-D-erythritol 2,4-cyclodiphosphate synthase